MRGRAGMVAEVFFERGEVKIFKQSMRTKNQYARLNLFCRVGERAFVAL